MWNRGEQSLHDFVEACNTGGLGESPFHHRRKIRQHTSQFRPLTPCEPTNLLTTDTERRAARACTNRDHHWVTSRAARCGSTRLRRNDFRASEDTSASETGSSACFVDDSIAANTSATARET